MGLCLQLFVMDSVSIYFALFVECRPKERERERERERVRQEVSKVIRSAASLRR